MEWRINGLVAKRGVVEVVSDDADPKYRDGEGVAAGVRRSKGFGQEMGLVLCPIGQKIVINAEPMLMPCLATILDSSSVLHSEREMT